jgi:hypothetical protein
MVATLPHCPWIMVNHDRGTRHSHCRDTCINSLFRAEPAGRQRRGKHDRMPVLAIKSTIDTGSDLRLVRVRNIGAGLTPNMVIASAAGGLVTEDCYQVALTGVIGLSSTDAVPP